MFDSIKKFYEMSLVHTCKLFIAKAIKIKQNYSIDYVSKRKFRKSFNPFIIDTKQRFIFPCYIIIQS